MVLEVPLVQQELDSNWCGLCCLQMVYAFYDRHRDLSKIAGELELVQTGVYAQELGNHLLSNGFAVDLVTRDTTRFPLIYQHMSPTELRVAIADRIPAADSAKEASFWRSLARFLDQGGRLTFRVPTIDNTLEPWVNLGRPAIVCLDVKSLHEVRLLDSRIVEESQPGQAGHYVVVTGVDSSTVSVADPLPLIGGLARHSRERFLYAWYSYQAYTLLAQPAAPRNGQADSSSTGDRRSPSLPRCAPNKGGM